MLLPNIPPPEEGIRYESEGVTAYISQRSLGMGKIYIAESRLSWVKNDCIESMSFDYPNIAIHAISRDESSFMFPCLYLMLDINIDEQSNGGHDSDEENADDENSEMTEVRFVPQDPLQLENMYKALNDCQVLHPDPEDVDELDQYDPDEGEYDIPEEENAEYEDHMEDDLEEHTNGNMDADNGDMGQFDDADQANMR